MTVVVAVMSVTILSSGCRAAQETESSGSNVITQDEVLEWSSRFPTAYHLVEQLRPQWMRKRGRVSLRGGEFLDFVVVYEDENRLGDPESLRLIPSQTVLEIQHYTAGEAIQFGPPDHPHGAIVVRTR